MIDEQFYKILFLLSIIPFYYVRLYYSKKFSKEDSPISNYPTYLKLMMGLTIITIILVPLIYIFTPFLDSFSIYLFDEIRLFGVLLFILVILSMRWILVTLKHNFDGAADNRYLVTSGPYKFARHPMYSIFILQGLAQTLISSNLIVSFGLIAVIILKILRVRYEDVLLTQEFKDQYVEYKKTTKALIPKIW